MDGNQNKPQVLKKDTSHCTICKHASSKTILYVCNSGHVLCERCQNNSSRQDCGDAIKLSHKKHKHGKCRNCKAKTQANTGLAGGDNRRDDNAPTTYNHANMSETIHSVNENNIGQDKIRRKSVELTVQYKNENNRGSDSSIENSAFSYKNLSTFVYNTGPISRPISCPVCAKIIAVNSIMVHYYFDHSKVPILTVRSTSTNPQQTLLKTTDIDLKTKCLSIFLIEDSKKYKNGADIENMQMTPVFLMGAKIATKVLALSNRENKETSSSKKPDSNCIGQNFDDDDTIILWICKLVDREIIYKVTLTRENKNLSYSYTGEANHIKDKQDIYTIYQNADGLILRGKAVNKLIKDGVLHVYSCVR